MLLLEVVQSSGTSDVLCSKHGPTLCSFQATRSSLSSLYSGVSEINDLAVSCCLSTGQSLSPLTPVLKSDLPELPGSWLKFAWFHVLHGHTVKTAVQVQPDSSFGMQPMGQHGGQPGAVASGILIKLLMDLWLHNPPGVSFPLALVLLHRCERPG